MLFVSIFENGIKESDYESIFEYNKNLEVMLYKQSLDKYGIKGKYEAIFSNISDKYIKLADPYI